MPENLERLDEICRSSNWVKCLQHFSSEAIKPETSREDWLRYAFMFFYICRAKNLDPVTPGHTETEEEKPCFSNMPFGKYRGKSIEWIVESDPGYAQWVVREVKNRYIRTLFEDLLSRRR